MIIYVIIVLQNNLNLLLVENNPILILIGLTMIYYLIKRIIEFFSLNLSPMDIFALYSIFLILDYLSSFYFVLTYFYLIIGMYLIFETYYLLAKGMSIEFQRIQLVNFPKMVYCSTDGNIVIKEKGILFKTLLGVYLQKVILLPGGKLDDVYKLLLAKKGQIIESEDATFFKFYRIKTSFFITSRNSRTTMKNELINTQNFIKNAMRFCID